MKSKALMIFKIFIIAVVAFNLLLRVTSEHAFELPFEERIGYLSMIMALILVSILPYLKKNWQTVVKYLTIFILLIVIATIIFLSKANFLVNFESWFVGFFFHLWDLSFLLVTGYVFYLTITDRLVRKDN